MDQKSSSFTALTETKNNSWETASLLMIVAKEATRKAEYRVKLPMEC